MMSDNVPDRIDDKAARAHLQAPGMTPLGLGYPYTGLKRLSDIVGPAYAKEITYTAAIYDSAAAKDMRLINGILPDDELEAHVLATAQTIANNAPLTVSAMKNIYANVFMDPDERDLDKCQSMVDRCFAS